jgi:LPXTG-motif cell wall-anchored protein
VSVSINSNSFDILDVEKRKFIGSINSDDFSSQQFKVQISHSPPANSSVEITVSFKDPSGIEHTKTTDVPINIKAAAQQGDGGLLAIIGIAIVVAAAYLLLRKRKEAKK